MPVKKPSTSKENSKKTSQASPKAKAVYRSEMKKNFRILFVALAVIVGAFFVIGGIIWLQGYNDELKGQKTIESYLEQKYDQDFIVEKPIHKGYGFAIEGVLEAIAYPKSDPELKFIATTNSRGSSDEYPGAFWRKQAHDYLNTYVTKAFDYTPEYTVRVVTYVAKGNEIKGHLPSFTEALAKYKSQIGLTIEVTSRETISTADRALVARRTHEIAEGIKNIGVAYTSVEYFGANGGGLSYSLGGPDYPELRPSQSKSVQVLEALVKEGR